MDNAGILFVQVVIPGETVREEIGLKLEVITTEEDLQRDYGLSDLDAARLHDSIPTRHSGVLVWRIERVLAPAAVGEINDAAVICDDQAREARRLGEIKEARRIEWIARGLRHVATSVEVQL